MHKILTEEELIKINNNYNSITKEICDEIGNKLDDINLKQGEEIALLVLFKIAQIMLTWAIVNATKHDAKYTIVGKIIHDAYQSSIDVIGKYSNTSREEH